MKNSMQDIISGEKRSIRRIHINKDNHNNIPERDNYSAGEDPILPPRPDRFKKGKVWVWIFAVLGVVVILFLILSFAFNGATLSITRQNEDVIIDDTFTAFSEPSPDALSFGNISLSLEKEKTAEVTGEETVDTKASGTIIIFNNFDQGSQKLIKNTRFETPEGLIYKIAESVVVPGRHENESGEVVPGSIEAAVFAETSGEKYNIGLSDFTIPAFEEQNDPRFFKFFARSKTAMTGGFSGIKKVVAQRDEDEVRENLQNSLRTELQNAILEKVPEDKLLLSGTIAITFDDILQTDATDETVVLVQKGTVSAVALDKQELARHIAETTVGSYDGAPVDFDSFEDLTLSAEDRDIAGEISFSIKGSGKLVWLFDEERLKSDLAGKDKRDIDMVLSAYPSIERAEIDIKPFWKRTFPKEKDITIELELE